MKKSFGIQSGLQLLAAVSLSSLSLSAYTTPLFPETLRPISLLATLTDNVADDFNADGNIDQAIIFTSGLGSGVEILPGNGNGDFAVSGGVLTGSNPVSVTSGDVNADGKPDLIVVDATDSTVSVLLGDGASGFSQAPGSPITVGTTPFDAVVADFNADSRMDIAVTSGAGSTVTILLGDGSGGFTATASPPAVGNLPVALIAGDVNADSNIDLMVANRTDNTVTVLLGDGAGGFTATASALNVGTHSVTLGLADFNGDGKPDLSVADSDANSVSLFFGDGAGGFTAATSPFAVGTKPIDMKVGDVNGDGKQDIVTANFTDNTISILLGNGSGGFYPTINTANSGSPLSIILADLDNDGKVDISATNYDGTVSFLWGKGTGAFSDTIKNISVNDYPSSIAVGDLNGDNKPDMVVASSASSGNISILLNTGAGDFVNTLGSPATVGASPTALSVVALGDLVGDSNLDLVVTNSTDNVAAVFKGDGTGHFTPVTGSPFSLGTGTGPQAVAIGDWDGYGGSDLVIANTTSSNISILLNTGTDSFGAASNIVVGTSPVSVALNDENHDNKLDILTANRGAGTLTFIPGDGAGGVLSAPVSLVVGAAPASVITGNLDGDALVDKVIANSGDGTLTVALGSGTNSTISVSGNPYSTAIGDFNGDTKPDIAVLTRGSTADSTLSILLGDGNGAFSPAPHFPFTIDRAATEKVDLVASDFNSDGNIDLALVNDYSPVVRVFLNLDPRPLAGPDTVTTTKNTAVTTANVLSNDVDSNQTGSLTVSAVDTSSVNGGSVTNNGDNTFTYLPAAGFTGTDSFNYTITDGWTKTENGTVSVTVNAASSGGGGAFSPYLLILLPGLICLWRKR